MRKSYVYVIKSAEPSVYKIGYSKQPKIRIQQLQKENMEYDLTLIYQKEVPHRGVKELEAYCHYVFDKYAIRGRNEWFHVDEKFIHYFIEKKLPVLAEFVTHACSGVFEYIPRSQILNEKFKKKQVGVV